MSARTGKTAVPSIQAAGTGYHIKGLNPEHDHAVDQTDEINVAINKNNDTLREMWKTDVGAAIAAHEAKFHKPVEEPPVVPPVIQPPPGSKIAKFPGNGPSTALAFLALVADNSLDIIEWTGGKYAWVCFLDVARTRPLKLAAIGDVIWDGTGTANTPPWRIGWSSFARNFSLDTSRGTFTAQNYAIGKAGVIMTRYAEDIDFSGIKFRNCYGDKAIDGTLGQQHAHAVYISTDGTHRSKNLVFNDLDVEGPANRFLNGVQTDGATSVDGLTVLRGKFSNLHRFLYAWSNPTGMLIDGAEVTDCDGAIDTWGSNGAQGIVKNVHAVRSGSMTRGQPNWTGNNQLLDGGGNTASN